MKNKKKISYKNRIKYFYAGPGKHGQNRLKKNRTNMAPPKDQEDLKRDS